jgi:hypothetical protein
MTEPASDELATTQESFRDPQAIPAVRTFFELLDRWDRQETPQ